MSAVEVRTTLPRQSRALDQRGDGASALEFVRATTEVDLNDCRRLATTRGLSSAGLASPLSLDVAMQPDDGTGRTEVHHAFLLRDAREPVAALWVREEAGDPGATHADCVVRGIATCERQGPGCSYRLLLTLWSVQWMVAHRNVRGLMAACRTDALHRYTPLGFEPVGRWFHVGGAHGYACVTITADASEVLDTGRELGLGRVLDSALAAAA